MSVRRTPSSSLCIPRSHASPFAFPVIINPQTLNKGYRKSTRITMSFAKYGYPPMRILEYIRDSEGAWNHRESSEPLCPGSGSLMMITMMHALGGPLPPMVMVAIRDNNDCVWVLYSPIIRTTIGSSYCMLAKLCCIENAHM